MYHPSYLIEYLSRVRWTYLYISTRVLHVSIDLSFILFIYIYTIEIIHNLYISSYIYLHLTSVYREQSRLSSEWHLVLLHVVTRGRISVTPYIWTYTYIIDQQITDITHPPLHQISSYQEIKVEYHIKRCSNIKIESSYIL